MWQDAKESDRLLHPNTILVFLGIIFLIYIYTNKSPFNSYHRDTFLYVNFSYVKYASIDISTYTCTAELSTHIIKYYSFIKHINKYISNKLVKRTILAKSHN